MPKSVRTAKEQWLRIVVFLAYLSTVLFLFSRHENWMDEAQAWLLARELNFVQLVGQMKYEGHPCLWHLILMPFAKLGFPYRTMNLISIALVTIAAVLLLQKSPIPLTWQIPVLFGSAFLFYMPVVSRSYALIPPFMLLNALLYGKRHQRPYAYGLSIALLVQTHLFILPFAGVLSLFWLFEALSGFRKSRDARWLLRQAIGLSLPLASLLLFLGQVSGAKVSSAYHFNWGGVFDWRYLLNSLNIYLFGFNQMECPSLLLARPRQTFAAILFFLFVPVGILFLRAWRKKDSESMKAAAIYTVSVAAQLMLAVLLARYATQKTAILAFFAVWLLWVLWPQLKTDKQMKRLALISYSGVALLFLLLNKAALLDIRTIYSDGRNCAAFIEETLPKDALIFQNKTECAVSVLVFLDDREFYSLESGQIESFATWVEREPAITTYDTFCRVAEEIRPGTTKAYILMSTDYVGPYGDILDHLQEDWLLYSSFLKEPIPREGFYLFQVPVER